MVNTGQVLNLGVSSVKADIIAVYSFGNSAALNGVFHIISVH